MPSSLGVKWDGLNVYVRMTKHSDMFISLVNNSMELSPPREPTNCAATREIPRILWNTEIYYLARFEVFTAVTMKNGVFWVVTSCGSCKNRRF
jgi:hypothetical protein